jgi:hypothetical protein
MKLPDRITTYKYPIKSHVEIEAEFNSLVEEWRAQTRMLSLVTQKSICKSTTVNRVSATIYTVVARN